MHQEKEVEISSELQEMKEYLNNIVEENIEIRAELARRADLIAALRQIIEEARKANQEYIHQQTDITRQQQLAKSQRIQQLMQDETSLKGSLKANLRFTINQRRRVRSKDTNHSKSSRKLAPSSESLLI
jgi:hypothetical protein